MARYPSDSAQKSRVSEQVNLGLEVAKVEGTGGLGSQLLQDVSSGGAREREMDLR